jgi:hypothetical protein
MQPLNHDMDDLMRLAAAGYPVKPQGADWDKVAQQLQDSGSTTVETGRHGFLKKLLFLLPLLLASFVCDRFLEFQYGHLKMFKTAEAGTSPSAKEVAPVPYTSAITAKGGVVSNAEIVPYKRTETAVAIPQKRTVGKKANYENSTDAAELLWLQTAPDASRSAAESAFTNTLPFPKALLHRNSITAHLPQRAPQQPGIAIAEKQPVTKQAKARHVPLKKWYVSVVAGPDVSRVKGQKLEEAGYSLGVLGGYNLTSRWGVETGLLWDKKNYYSKGAYFKTDKIYLLPHSEVVQVAGYCAMFEIPVNVRFNAVRTRDHVVFASGGVSSYLMQKEDYYYVYRRYGEDYAGNKLYKDASKNWFSVANISLGYERRILKRTSLRIEPYARIPLKGVGIGSLPLSSMGVLVGITRPIQ